MKRRPLTVTYPKCAWVVTDGPVGAAREQGKAPVRGIVSDSTPDRSRLQLLAAAAGISGPHDWNFRFRNCEFVKPGRRCVDINRQDRGLEANDLFDCGGEP